MSDEAIGFHFTAARELAWDRTGDEVFTIAEPGGSNRNVNQISDPNSLNPIKLCYIYQSRLQGIAD